MPSGSCGAMMRVFYLDSVCRRPGTAGARAQDLSQRVCEFHGVPGGRGRYDPAADAEKGNRTVAYHPSCHLLREMEVTEAPRRLLDAAPGVEQVELPDAEQCCGFGGTFAVKYPHISEEMLADKIAAATSSGADTLTACDMGCLMHIGGAVSRQGLPFRVRHIAQVLDGEAG